MYTVTYNSKKVVVWKGHSHIRVIYVNGRDPIKIVDEVKLILGLTK